MRRFIDDVTPTSIVAPLTFERPTRIVRKSEAENRQARIAHIQNKELRYKRTAQYAESLTAFIPNLISHMLSKKLSLLSLPYERAKTYIYATY